MYKYKDKTFLYYFAKDSLIWKIPVGIKIIIYLLLNAFVLFNNFYILNLVLSSLIFIFLILIGFVKYRTNLFKILFISLFLFFVISFFLQTFQTEASLTNLSEVAAVSIYIFEFFSKWLLINLGGLLMFTILSQDELISFLIKIKLNFRLIISITIAFNLITRLLETLEEIDISLKSRNLKGKGIVVLFNRIKYIFISMLVDNIEYISSLRATYEFDYKNIKESYEK